MAADPVRPPTDLAPPPVPRRDFLGRALAFLAGGALFGRPRPASAGPAAVHGSMPFVGEVRIFAGDFAPSGWAFCDGQLLPISQNTALFSLLGTAFGGNGQSTFALPDLQGRVPIHPGQGPGLTLRTRGEIGGEETHTLTEPEMATHLHMLRGSASNGTTNNPAGALLAMAAAGIPQYGTPPDANLAATAVAAAGGNQPHENMQPYLTVTYIIALQGIYPSMP